MAIKPTYIIDTSQGTATLDIYVEDIFVTTYSYEASQVTLAQRPNTDVVTLENLGENIKGIGLWIDLIYAELRPTLTKRSEFEEEMKKSSNTLTAKIENDGDLITDVSFNNNDTLTTFQARAQVSMEFSDFKAWYSLLNRFHRESLNFS